MGLQDPTHGRIAKASDMAQEVQDAVGPAWDPAPWPGVMEKAHLRTKEPDLIVKSEDLRFQEPLVMLRESASAWHAEPASH